MAVTVVQVALAGAILQAPVPAAAVVVAEAEEAAGSSAFATAVLGPTSTALVYTPLQVPLEGPVPAEQKGQSVATTVLLVARALPEKPASNGLAPVVRNL